MKDTPHSEDFAIILAGGQSSRMGQDKTLLRLDGETMLERVYQIVSPLVSEIVIMLSQSQDRENITGRLSGNFKVGLDSTPLQGPLQGISDAVHLLPDTGRFIYILSCDLPYLTTTWLDSLRLSLLSNDQADIVCTSSDGFKNPLIAVYRFPVVKKAKTLVNSGKRSCLALLDSHLVINQEPQGEESLVTVNINTPDDYHKVIGKKSLS